jgi:hypothetical protein
VRKECGYLAGQFLTVEADKRKAERLEKFQAERRKLQRKVFRFLSLDSLSSYSYYFPYAYLIIVFMMEYRCLYINSVFLINDACLFLLIVCMEVH